MVPTHTYRRDRTSARRHKPLTENTRLPGAVNLDNGRKIKKSHSTYWTVYVLPMTTHTLYMILSQYAQVGVTKDLWYNAWAGAAYSSTPQ